MILKIGGSVLTEKSSENELDRRPFETSLNAVAESPDDLVLVHGAGSYGHPQASRYGVHKGTNKGVYETHVAVKELNTLVVDYLRNAGVNALPVHPLSCSVKQPEVEVYSKQVRGMVSEGFLPVLHGDCAVHNGYGASIVSGDDVVVELAEKDEKVGMCTSTGGVLDANGDVMDRVSDSSEVDELDTSARDVTGGIRSKVEKLLMLDNGGYVFGAEDISEFLGGGEPGTLVRRTD